MSETSRRFAWLIVFLSCLTVRGAASPDPQGDSSQVPAPSARDPLSATPAPQVSWRIIGPNILRDQKHIWTFPLEVKQGKHWKPALGLTLATAGLVALDPHDTPYFRSTGSFSQFNKLASGPNTLIGVTAFPVAYWAVGRARRDPYAQQTAWLAGQAFVDVQILTLVMKNIDRRIRPSDVPPNGDFTHTWFKSKSSFISGGQSFPSGHTIAAFSVATVFAERYRHKRWVPWVAYGLASVVGFSRVTLQSHFPSDVFAGAVLGYAVSHYVVLRR